MAELVYFGLILNVLAATNRITLRSPTTEQYSFGMQGNRKSPLTMCRDLRDVSERLISPYSQDE
jgi:hypothetical protein